MVAICTLSILHITNIMQLTIHTYLAFGITLIYIINFYKRKKMYFCSLILFLTYL